MAAPTFTNPREALFGKPSRIRNLTRLDTLPVIIFGVLLAIVSFIMILLTQSVSAQVNTGTSLIGYNLADQTRVYVQLQREVLRLVSVIERSAADYNADDVQRQYELALSRVNHMNRTSVEAIMPPDVLENYEILSAEWANVDQAVQTWMNAPDDDGLRQAAIDALTEYERQTNTTEIVFNRARANTLSEFARNSQQIPIIFLLTALAFGGLILTAFFAFNRYLRQTRETAAVREANRVKDQFVAVMSHELRTPLNAIIGFLGIMKMGGNLPERAVHMVDRSRANAERLLTLIDDILDISKIEAGSFDIHPENVNVRELSQKWIAQTEVLALEKRLRFSATVANTVPEILSLDPDAMTKIVTNLLSNAVKFTREGSVSLILQRDGNDLQIQVKDTGIGIPADKQALIFESFRQVDSSTKRAFGGSGLGLFIVKQLTALLGGSIQVESALNVGSTFTVRVPLKPATPAPAARIGTVTDAPAAGIAPLAKPEGELRS